MPKRDEKDPGDPMNMIGDDQIRELEKMMAEMQKNGALLPGMPSNIGDLVRNAKDVLKNVGNDPCIPVVGGNRAFKYIPFTLPASRKAVLLSAFFTEDVDRCLVFADMLKMRGYTVDQPDHNLTLTALRNLPGQDIGVLYLASHATSHGYVRSGTRKNSASSAVDEACNPGYFGIGTEEITSAEIAQRKSDEADGLVERLKFDRVGTSGVVSEVFGYSARIAFFKKYWLDAKGKPKKIFADQSLVVISACDVSNFEFIELLELCGAGTILAWNENIAPNVASSTANYIFDRLLGLNMAGEEFFPEKMKQRPFQWGMAMLDIKHHRSLAGSPLGGPFKSFETGKDASLLSYCRNDCPGPFLAPSICMFRVDEDKKRLYIDGKFGPDKGASNRTVSISDNTDMSGAKTLEVETWDENVITCILSPDTAGYIRLTVDGRTSNCLPLTEWKGQIVATAKGDASVEEVCAINFSLRMDAHLCRLLFTLPLNGASSLPTSAGPGHEAPAEVFAAYEASYVMAMAPLSARASFVSTLKYQASGTAHYDPPKGVLTSLSLSGNGEVPWAAINRGGMDGFDLMLMISRNIKPSTSPALPFDETYNIIFRSEISTASTKYKVERTTTTRGNQSKKEHVPVYLFSSVLGSDLLNLEKQLTFDLPDPRKNELADGVDFRSKTLNISAIMRFAPDLLQGEDYFKGQ